MQRSESEVEKTQAYKDYYVFHRRQQAFFEPALDAIRKEIKRVEEEETSNQEESINRFDEAIVASIEWMAVIMVTGIETYLVDLLASTASLEPSVMSASEQKASYQEVLDASSIEELAAELKRRWARNFIEDGGPRRWIGRLKGYGAKYPETMALDLEELWGVRHIVIHNGGKLTQEFLKRHPSARLRDDRRLSGLELPKYAKAVEQFVEITDEHFARWHAALRIRAREGAT